MRCLAPSLVGFFSLVFFRRFSFVGFFSTCRPRSLPEASLPPRGASLDGPGENRWEVGGGRRYQNRYQKKPGEVGRK